MIKANIQYLARDKLYKIEKPYRVEFDVEEDEIVKSTNHIFTSEPIAVHAIQASDSFELDKHGFCLLNEETNLDAHTALHTPDLVESAYLEEVKAILHRKFPEYKRMEPLEFVVRRILPSLVVFDLQHECGRLENAMSDSRQKSEQSSHMSSLLHFATPIILFRGQSSPLKMRSPVRRSITTKLTTI